MRASDFVITSTQRVDSGQQLIQTELTDAVNSGIVDRADKSERSLKGSLYTVGKRGATGGAKSAALAAATRRRGTDVAGDGGGEAGAETESGPSAATGGRADRTSAANTKAQTTRHLSDALKSNAGAGARDAVVGAAVGSTLSNTSLEGTDDAAYKVKGGYNLVRGIRKRLAGRDALESENSLGKLSEKSYKAKRSSQDATTIQRQMQSRRNMREGIEAAKAETSKKAATVATTSTSGGGGLLAGTVGVVGLRVLVGLLVALLILTCVFAGNESQKKSASMNGMPAWVTYDLVDACLKAHEKYGYPASALLGQMMIENGTSDSGSELGRLYHNYGGVKYAGYDYGGLITGSVSYLTTEYDSGGGAYKTYAAFSVFASDDAYMTYRCEHLYKQSNYTRVADYQTAIDTNDSALFLQALGEGGYYTASTASYVATYRSLCDSYPLLASLDSMTSAEFESSQGSGTGVGGGADYASAEQWQKNIVAACYSTPCAGAHRCATWVTWVYQNAGLGSHTGNGNSMLSGYATSSDWSNIKVGQIVSAQCAPGSAGQLYGHVGIYIGDGNVMENVTVDGVGVVRTRSLTEWVGEYSRYGWVRYGWPW